MSSFLHPDRLFPQDQHTRSIARDLFEQVSTLPIISPHGHTDPEWFATNEPFKDATSLLLTPDHYVLRMLHSRGLSFDDLGVPRRDGCQVADGRSAWRLFASNYDLFLGTPSRLWLDHALNWGFGISEPLSADNADQIYDLINERLSDDASRPMAILDRAKVDCIATTEFALDPLKHHSTLKQDGKIGRIRTTYRPDDVTDPDHPSFLANLVGLGELTGEDSFTWAGMINAHRKRRAFFRLHGATATDHGVPDAGTADLPETQKQPLLDRLVAGPISATDAQLFRAQMLTEMAGLGVEDGMVMQIHAGVRRSTDPTVLASHGPNLGADIPTRISPAQGLEPMLQRYGHHKNFRLIFFCQDEAVFARELAPMAGYWPALHLGPPWWFHDSARGIARYLDNVVESAGFMNLAGFNDDTRALLSIPARHDVWRRCLCAFFAELTTQHVISKNEAEKLATYLSSEAARATYRLPAKD